MSNYKIMGYGTDLADLGFAGVQMATAEADFAESIVRALAFAFPGQWFAAIGPDGVRRPMRVSVQSGDVSGGGK